MIPVTHEMSLLMTSSNRLICQEAMRRGWQVRMPYWYTSHFYINRGDGNEVHVFSSSPQTMSFAAAHMSNDKYATSKMLDAHRIPQLPVYLLEGEINTEAVAFMNTNAPVIVKPLDGSHGNGITANIASQNQLQVAVEKAQKNSKSGKVLLQKQILGEGLKDLRVLVIDGKYIGAINRVPARVFGDGKLTVEQLILEENQQPHRGEPYKNKLAVIDLDSVRLFLGDKLHYVPAEGEEITVLGVANYGAGGELVDITDIVPGWMREEAVRIAKVLELPVAGVDYMMSGSINDLASSSAGSAMVIEVNKGPALCIHDEPTVGENRGAVKAYVDYLASI